MNRSLFEILALFTVALWAVRTAPADEARPNIVWITTEDNSPHWLRVYNPDGGAPMPNVEGLAAEGLVFNHAFSNAPVCSVARSTIISGCYAPRVGAQYHRRTQPVPLPGELKMFPHYLRQVGYYTTNNSKEDYNFIRTPTAWDESSPRASYRKRSEGQPFFHVQNFTTTHESRLHFTAEQMANEKTTTDPDDVEVFPYHPDTPTFRYTYARLLDQHRKVDEEIGRFLDQLGQDGLLEETIIFYYGDHGGVLPRSKGYVYESGLQVPMVVRFPAKWQHLAPAVPGTRIDGFVNFFDLAPTVLHLAGIDVPEEMDGRAFLGAGITLEELNSRNGTFAYADRFDEKYDLVRSGREGKFKYIRNYQPFNFDGLYNEYRYKMLAYAEWRTLVREGKLNEIQMQFFEPRPAEALYDLEADPHEVHNLAGEPAHAQTLRRLREAMRQEVTVMSDLSFYPEPYFLEHGADDPVEFGRRHRDDIVRLVEIADLSLQEFPKSRDDIARALAAEDPWERYWGCIVCSCFGERAEEFVETARRLAATDEENLVRVRAAEFLALIGVDDPRPVLQQAVADAGSPTEANLILNTATLLQDAAGYDMRFDSGGLPQAWLKDSRAPLSRRLDYFNMAP
jgi:arylsulfatase A-like enzyme